ncbi:hypothetical protein GEU84_019615 [Fertoebacter nigrum]|uniref:Uncharacterized protein n=1 Tax=Fertoeibacter niger TaxID=2656921 RepID=A0A8X8H560_9RHOB|nr:hypothetical protein [Fertoeibacter niger]NUB46604.1 hypothetical protein [Fertoeibacter niger]
MRRKPGEPLGGDAPGAKPPAGRDAELLRREARLKAALKANMARRKAQARARASAERTGGADATGAGPDAHDAADRGTGETAPGGSADSGPGEGAAD